MHATRRVGWLSAALLSVCLAPATGWCRTWTNDEGQTLEAQFVRIRGTSVLLRDADRKVIPAPISRLSEADQQWVDQYKDLAGQRLWTDAAEPLRGRLVLVRDDHAELTLAGKRFNVPLEELNAEDLAHITTFYEHVERDLPESFAAASRARPVAAPSAPTDAGPVAPGEERSWTDVRGRTIRAAYGGVEAGKVVLLRGGKRFDFPVERLSSDDQAWVAQQGLANLMGDLRDGLKTAQAVTTQAVTQTILEKGMPPMPEPVAAPPAREWRPEPPAPAEPPAPTQVAVSESAPPPVEEPTETVSATPPVTAADHGRGEPPWINDINDISPNEYEIRYEAYLGGYEMVDWDDVPGDAYCEHCQAEFVIRPDYHAGDACPFCGVPVQVVHHFDHADFEDDDGGWRTPWYLRRTGRRLIIFVVVTVIGAGVKVMMTGGGDD